MKYKKLVVSLLMLGVIFMSSIEPASAYFRSYAFKSFTDQSDSWGRTKTIYMEVYPDDYWDDPSKYEDDLYWEGPTTLSRTVTVNSEKNAFDGDRSTYVEGKSVEPVWGESGNLLCGRTGWLTLNLYQVKEINRVSFEYAAALANKAITVQVYNRWTHQWKTVVQGVYEYNSPNMVPFRTVYTDRIRVRIETGEDGPLPWSGDFSVHGAYIYEIQASLQRRIS